MDSLSSKLQGLAQSLALVEAEVSTAENEVVALEQQHAAAVTRLNEAQMKQSDILEQVIALGRAGHVNISNRVEVNVDDDNRQRLFSLPIVDLGLSVRSVNCLKAENIYFIGDLMRWKEEDFSRIPNLGKKCCTEIENALLERGLALGMSGPSDSWLRPDVPKDY